MLIVYCPGCGKATLELGEVSYHVRCLACLNHWVIVDAIEHLLNEKLGPCELLDFMTEQQELDMGRDMQNLEGRN